MENTQTAVKVLDTHDSDMAYKIGYLAPELVAGALIVGVAGKVVYRYRSKISAVLVGAWEYLHTMDERFKDEIIGKKGESNVVGVQSPVGAGPTDISEAVSTFSKEL